MKTSNITKSALALALGLCASAALATNKTALSEDFEGDAFDNGVNGVTTNNLTWADTEGYTAVTGGKLVVDAADTPTSATIDNTTAGQINGAFGRNAKFNATVSFVPATEAPTVADTNNDLKFALYALASGASTNLCVLADGGSQTVTALSSVADQDIEIAFTAANTFTVKVGTGSANGPYTFKNTGSISKLEFQGNGDVETLGFSYDLVPFSLQWPAGYTAVSYTIAGGAAQSISGSSPASIDVEDGDAVTFTFRNADDAEKTLSATAAAGSVTSIDASTATFGWADYLGAAVDGAYQIDDFADLDMLRKGVAAGLVTSNETFKQTANIDMATAGAFAGIGTGAENEATLTSLAFCGTYDGNNKTISNITFTNRKGSGLFNLIRHATIKDLTVDTVSYEAAFAATKLGGAMIVGNGVDCTLQHLVTLGSNGAGNPSTYNAAGIANRLEGRGGPVLVIGCTNNAAIYGCYSKIGGICPIVQGASTTVTFVDCANTGAIVANGTTAQTTLSGKTPGVDGAAGILGYTQGGNGLLSFTNCVNTGTITGVSGTKKASILGYTTASGVTMVGGSAQDDIKSVDTGANNVSGAKFATVDNGVATFVADSALALNGEYKVMADSATATFVFAEAGTIAFDTALATPTYAVTAPGLVLSDSTSGTVKTYTARAYATVTVTVTGGANATAAWTVDGASAAAPSTLTEGQTYSVTYTANEGYKFADGATTSASGTAGTEAISINIADAVADSPSYNEDQELTIGGESGTPHELTQIEAEYLNAMAAGKTPAQMESILAGVNEDTFEKAALLNQDITEANAGSYEFNVTKIKKSGGTVKVTVKLTRSGTLIGGINGTLVLQTCATPTGTYADAQTLDIDGTAFAGSEAEATAEFTFTGVTDKFFKAVIR